MGPRVNFFSDELVNHKVNYVPLGILISKLFVPEQIPKERVLYSLS